MFKIVALFVLWISSASAIADDWSFTSKDIVSLHLNKKLEEGFYELYACDAAGAIGSLEASNETLYSFCVDDNGQRSKGMLDVTAHDVQVCLFVATTDCDDSGFCSSALSPNDCAVVRDVAVK